MKPNALRKIGKPNENGCWIWQGVLNRDGYGMYNRMRAHRMVYEEHVGKIPDGLVLDHLCRVRCCVNPAHLEPVTRGENVKRSPIAKTNAHHADKTHCPKGHPYEGDNLRYERRGDEKWRVCVICRRAKDERRRRARGCAVRVAGDSTPEQKAYWREYNRTRRRKAKKEHGP